MTTLLSFVIGAAALYAVLKFVPGALKALKLVK